VMDHPCRRALRVVAAAIDGCWATGGFSQVERVGLLAGPS
jgi:hypothetical protein